VLLAIETACAPGGIALAHRGELLAEHLFAEGEQSGAALVPAIQALLRARGLGFADLDALALSVGPGSFTGLRVGLATALGLCFAHPHPVVPIGTLAALSLGARGAPQIAALLDARRGQLYAGLYGPDAQPLLPERVCDPEPWLRELAARPGELALLGSGVAPCAELAREILGPRAQLQEGPSGPRPAWLAELGERGLARGEARPAEQIRLSYLRRPEAEEQLALAQARASGASC
jgi:tRNA threonylcarbamoyladenosine biosynthesis protein TsaB